MGQRSVCYCLLYMTLRHELPLEPTKLRGAGRIKEYREVRRQAHQRDRALAGMEKQFEPTYGWTVDELC